MDIVKTLEAFKIVPVIVIEDADKAVPLAKALVDGGLPVVEVTFRTKAAPEAIARIAKEVPDAVVGAGTVLTKEQLKRAIDSGAKFAVAPGFDSEIFAEAKKSGFPFVPGVATASELSCAIRDGAPMVKFFPAEVAGGVKAIKALLGAFRFTGVRFMPTGGVSLNNLADYLAVPEIAAVGGTWIAPAKLIDTSDWDAIRKAASEAVSISRRLTFAGR